MTKVSERMAQVYVIGLENRMGKDKLRRFIDSLGSAGLRDEIIETVLADPTFARSTVRAILQLMPPSRFVLSVDSQLARLKAASRAQGWGFDESDFHRLSKTAPPWPLGKLAVRSLRIRIGKGWDGVQKTFRSHLAEIGRVYKQSRVLDAERITIDQTHLRLHLGNDSHRPCVEWICVDLDAYRDRRNIKQIRGKSSLADEMLALCWMFPEVFQAMDGHDIPGFFAAGYELIANMKGGGLWQLSPHLRFNQFAKRVEVSTGLGNTVSSEDSVPTIISD